MTARVVNVHEAKTHLSRLLRDVEAGQEIEIARDGKSIMKLVRVVPKVRPLGGDEGTVFIAEDFDEMEEDLLELFHTDDLRWGSWSTLRRFFGRRANRFAFPRECER